MSGYRKKKESQQSLFDAKTIQDEEWRGMPEFVQNKQEPYAKIIVRFSSQEDLDAFSALIDQKLTRKTKSIWFPFRSHFRKKQDPIWIASEK